MPGTISFGAIAAAIATEFAAVTPPAGLAALTVSTAELPENIGTTPCILVFPFDEGRWEYEPSQREGVFEWPVRFIYDMVKDFPRRTVDLYAWMDALYAVFPQRTNINLGLGGYVRDTTIVGNDLERLRYPADSDTFWPCLTIRVATLLGEPITS